LLVGTAIAAAIGGRAQAQDQPTSSPVASDNTLGEVVVTARRRSEILAHVPESIVAVSEQTIAQKSIRQIGDVMNITPNVSIVESQDPGLAAITIRGVGQVRNGDPAVAFVIDGVQLISSDSFSQPLYDIKSIEVLKGPQGAFYGRDAMGGAIVVTSKPPTNDLEGYFQGTYANGDDEILQGAIRGPLIKDKLMFSLAGNVEDFGGVFKSSVLTNAGEPRRVDFSRNGDVQGRLIGNLTDKLTVDVRAGYNTLHAGASYYIPTNNPNDFTTPIQSGVLGYSNRQIFNGSAKIDYDFGFAKLTSVTSYEDVRLFLRESLDWLPDQNIGATQARHKSGTSEELRLTSPSNQRFRWMVGGYGLWQDYVVNTNLLLTLDPTDPLGFVLPITKINEHGTDAAVFSQVNYDLTSKLELTAALRWDDEHRRQMDLLTGNVVSASWSKVQPKLSLAYRWTSDVLTYATYGVGFRSGGFNSPGAVFPASYKAESVTSYEVGAKSTLFDRRLRLDGAFFYNDISNYQVFALSQALQGLFNVAKSRVAGAEVDAEAQLPYGFRVDAAVGYTDSRIDKYVPTGAGFERSVPVVPSQIVGNSLPFTYRWSTQIGLQYRRDFEVRGTPWYSTVRIDYTERSGNYWTIDNLSKERDRNLFDASLQFESLQWAVTVYVKNMFDKRYTEEFFPQNWCCTFTGIRWPGEPRRFGVTVRRNF